MHAVSASAPGTSSSRPRGDGPIARCLIVACGCRGLELARGLKAQGHGVRGTTRDPQRLAVLEAAGVEPVLADPDRVATLAPALDHVVVAYLLLGSAVGEPAALEGLHGPRLEMLLSKVIDSTVRGIVYEAAGSVPAAVLEAGAQRVRAFAADAHVPHVLLERDPADHAAWGRAALEAAGRVLAG